MAPSAPAPPPPPRQRLVLLAPAGAVAQARRAAACRTTPSLAGLWRGGRLTDFALGAEGVEFKAHKVASPRLQYFLNPAGSGMRDARTPPTRSRASGPRLEVLLAFV